MTNGDSKHDESTQANLAKKKKKSTGVAGQSASAQAPVAIGDTTLWPDVAQAAEVARKEVEKEKAKKETEQENAAEEATAAGSEATSYACWVIS